MKTKTFPRMHVSLYVGDIEKTVDFYNAFFDQDANKVKPGYAKYELEEPALIISFVENKERVKENFGHLGIQVDSLNILKQRLETVHNNGLQALEEMGTSCCFALQDKFWVKDPDGHQWEIYFFHKDVEFNDPKYEMGKAVIVGEVEEGACCEPGSSCC